jgi:hypothetical protein
MKVSTSPFFAKIYKSATSFSFYKEVLSDSFNQTLKFLLLFVLTLSLILTTKQFYLLSKEADKLEEWLLKNNIRIEDGKLISPSQESFEIKEHNFVLVFDPTGKTTDINEKYENAILITDKLVKVKNMNKIQEIPFSKMKNLTLDKKTISKYKKLLLTGFLVLMSSFIFIGTLVVKLIQIIFCTAIVFLIIKLIRINLSFENLLNICTYAIVPPSIFNICFSSLNIKISYFSSLYFAMYTLFITGALFSCKPKEEEEKKENEEDQLI